VQLDEVAIAILCDPAAREKVKAAGGHPDRLSTCTSRRSTRQ